MSAEKILHVVAFDVPFPPDYGGVIDIYYRCKALKEAGFSVILHCFEYGRGRNHDYSSIADEVHYYTRSKRLLDWFSREPFIVRTRASEALLERLLQDNHLILFEGQHTTAFLQHPALQNRKKLVRLHNIEWQYYSGLAERAEKWTERRYFRSEARKLKRHEQVLNAATALACISHSDTKYYEERFSNAVYMPVAFSPETHLSEQTSDAPFFLFHGNLSVAENEEGVLWLINMLSGTEYTLVVAGKNPSVKLKNACVEYTPIKLIANPSKEELEKLMTTATAHLVIGFQESGIKLKLLHSLATGKRCIVTPAIVAGTGLEHLCAVVSNRSELLEALKLPQPEVAEQKVQQAFICDAFSPSKTLAVIRKYLFD